MGEYHDKMISFEKEVIFSYKDLLQRPIDVAEITFDEILHLYANQRVQYMVSNLLSETFCSVIFPKCGEGNIFIVSNVIADYGSSVVISEASKINW